MSGTLRNIVQYRYHVTYVGPLLGVLGYLCVQTQRCSAVTSAILVVRPQTLLRKIRRRCGSHRCTATATSSTATAHRMTAIRLRSVRHRTSGSQPFGFLVYKQPVRPIAIGALNRSGGGLNAVDVAVAGRAECGRRRVRTVGRILNGSGGSGAPRRLMVVAYRPGHFR